MTPLADELAWLLRTSGEALLAQSMPNILNAIGFGIEKVPDEKIEAALDELLTAGLAQKEHRRGRCYYSVMTPVKAEPARHAGSG